MVRTIRLYGRLRKQFGEEFQLDASTPAEAVRALCTLVPGFRKELEKGSYAIKRGSKASGKNVVEDTLHLGLGSSGTMHIIPATAQNKRGLGKVILGIALIAASFIVPGGWGISSYLLSAGISMTLTGISMMLTPTTQPSKPEEDKGSSLFSGPENTSMQGVPVPVVYGEVLAGSVVVSAGITTEMPTPGYDGSGGAPGWAPSIYDGPSGFWKTDDFVDPSSEAAPVPWKDIDLSKGGKSGGSAGGKESPDSLRSNATARIIDLVSEGPIFGLSDTVDLQKSVMLDNVWAQNLDDSFNFEGMIIEQRLGEPDQEPLSGFSDAETETSVGVTVLDSTPVVRAISDTDTDACRVTIRVPQLFKVDDEGNIKGTSVQFDIEVSDNGGPYNRVIAPTISGKTTSVYEKSYRFALPGTGPWNIRVSRITPETNSAKEPNDILWSSYTEIVEAKLIYPNSALIGVTVDAAQFGTRIPRRAYLVKGRIVEVPTNYDPDTRTYATTGPGTTNGVWDGTFKTAWTDNPAWCFRDMLLHTRYGLGNDFDDALTNKWMLYEISQYCDELVDDGQGGQEPRYTFNVQIKDRVEAWELMQQFVSVFRGMYYWGSGLIDFSYDHDEEPTLLVSPTNAVGGLLNYSSDAYEGRHSVVIVAWSDPDANYEVNYEVIEDRDLIAQLGYRTLETTAWGCTSRGQARRYGRWILDTEKYAEVLTYEAGWDHGAVRPGQVLEVNDPEYTSSRFGGRVGSGSTKSTIKLDSTVTITNAGTVRVNLPDGTVEERTVTNGAGATTELTLSSDLSEAPVANATWSYAESGVENRLFRVVSIEEARSEEAMFRVTATWHDPNKFARVESGMDLPPNNFSDIDWTSQLNPPREIQASDTMIRNGDATICGLLVSWTAPADPRVTAYEWQYSSTNDPSWSDPMRTERTSVTTSPIPTDTYTVRVRSLNELGMASSWIYRVVVVDGLEYDPPALTNVQKVKDLSAGVTRLEWDAVPKTVDSRPIRYEVLFHASSTVLANATSLGVTDRLEATIKREGKYHVRGVFGLATPGPATLVEVAAADLTGSSTTTAFLTNESHTVATASDGSGGSYASAGGQMTVISSNTDVTASSSFAVGSSDAGLSISINSSGVYTVTNLTVDQATAVLEATYNGLTLQRTYSISKSKAGTAGGSGADAPIIRLLASRQVMRYDTNGSIISGQDVTFTTESANVTGNTFVRLYRLDDTGGETQLDASTYLTGSGTVTHNDPDSNTFSMTGTTITLTPANFHTATASGTDLGLRIEVTRGGVTDTISVVRVSDGEQGVDGQDGQRRQLVYLYQRSAGTPTKPSTQSTYNFDTKALTGFNNGWSATIPTTNGNPLWVTVATAATTGTTDTIEGSEWSAPVKLSQDGNDGTNGTDGVDGLNVAVVPIYIRSATTPAVPNNDTTFTFASGLISGSLDGWTQSIPETNGLPLWVSTITASAITATDLLEFEEWAAPTKIVEDGQAAGKVVDDFDHTNVAIQDLYTYAGSIPDISYLTDQADCRGGTAMRVGNNSGDDQLFIGGKADHLLIPVGTDRLYRVRARVRQANGGAGNCKTYLGIAGYRDDKTTLCNASGSATLSSQHYFAASNVTAPFDWTVYTGYFWGPGTTSDAAGGQHNDPNNPGQVHPNVRFVAPLLILNYNGQAGVADVDWIEVEDITESEGMLVSDDFADLDDWIDFQNPSRSVANNALTITQVSGVTYEGVGHKRLLDTTQPWAIRVNAEDTTTNQIGVQLYDEGGQGQNHYFRLTGGSNNAEWYHPYGGSPSIFGTVTRHKAWLIVGDGHGNVTLFVKGQKVGTLSGVAPRSQCRVRLINEANSVGLVGTFSQFRMGQGEAAVGAIKAEYIQGYRAGDMEDNADVTKQISGKTEIIIQADSDGTVKSGQTGVVRATYKLAAAGAGAVTADSWSVVGTQGSWAGSGPSISSGGALTIGSAPNGEVLLDVKATYNGKQYGPFVVRVTKVNDAFTGGGSQNDDSSTWANHTGNTTFTEVLRLTATTPSTAGNVNLTADNIAVNNDYTGGLWVGSNLEMKWQRSIANANSWTDVGAVANSNPDTSTIDYGGGIYGSSPGAITCNRTWTGAADSTSYDYRLVVRWSTSNAHQALLSGQASVEST